MPAGRPEATGSNGGAGRGAASGPQRANFRPPWVKDAPQPIPMPTAPWVHANRNKEVQNQPQNDAIEQKAPPARKTSSVKIVPIQPAENGTTSRDPHTFQIPKLKEVPKSETKQAPPRDLQVPKLKETPKTETTKLQSREVKVPITLTTRPKETPIQVHIESKKTTQGPTEEPEKIQKQEELKVLPPVRVKELQQEPELIDKAIPTQRNAILRQESMKKLTGPTPPPMPPPMPPSAPKLPSTLSAQQQEKIEQLRSRPRRRPDWGAMMKEVESGKKLKHVECNDRSQPLLPDNKAKEGQFIYESEKPNLHNQLLKQIQSGTLLKHVKTNDRSKPFLEGLRKFRRQMTIEEQIQKSQSIANMAEPEVEEEADEMDDIDKIRDDLQSTKQMLALELRNKEAQIRENKRLQARILNLEAELEREKLQKEKNSNDTAQGSTIDEKVMQTLKEEAKEARKTAEELEHKYHETTDQLIITKADLEDIKKHNQMLEKKLALLQGGDISKRQSVSERRDSEAPKEAKSDSESEVESESESESDECSNEEKAQRRAEREIRLMRNKLRSYKNKEEAARRERKTLREQMKKNQQAIKVEKKKYKELQREVNKMAALMRDEDEEEDEEKEEEDELESEETETESESETSEEDEEEGQESESDNDDDVPLETQKENLQTKAKRHENCLNALKKGNYMLKTNVDRLQDDLNKQKEDVLTLQEDLDSVLAELG